MTRDQDDCLVNSKITSKPTLVVTGSSGFVASDVLPRLNSDFKIVGIDRTPGAFTSVEVDISKLVSVESVLPKEDFYVLHLAAARFDYGASAVDYYTDNVTETEQFLKWLETKHVSGFIHISSVAAFDGEHIPFHERLGCDDAYRATKFLQGETVKRWARKCGVSLYVLYPSAIFSEQRRSDTNIGKLQSVASLLPVLVKVPSKKSLTYLPAFSKFIEKCLHSGVNAGEYLTIERPILSVTDTLAELSPRKTIQVAVPFLETILTLLAYILWRAVGGRVDTKLTPNRVKKLFADTDCNVVPSGVDLEVYNSDHEATHEILKLVAEANRRDV